MATSTELLSPTVLVRLRGFVAEKLGLHYPPERENELVRGFLTAMREMKFDSPEAFLERLLATPVDKEGIEVLAGQLTIGETYFFRNHDHFALLEETILPSLIRHHRTTERRLRIWSAGCCTGEEIYSVAIILTRILPDWREWNLFLLGTDINPRFLEKAVEGVYREWSFRDAPPWLLPNYFERTETGTFRIRPEIRNLVTFAPLNLAEDRYPSLWNNTNAMDLILCRNVLMYFTPEVTEQVLRRFAGAMTENSFLLLSANTDTRLIPSELQRVPGLNALVYQKTSSRPSVPSPSQPRLGKKPSRSKASLPSTRNIPRPPPLPSLETISPRVVSPTSWREAEALYQKEAYEEAAALLESWLGRDRTADFPHQEEGEEEEAMALLARCYANIGRFSEAQHWCEKAIERKKLVPLYHYLLATVLNEMGKTSEAIAALRRALYLDPNFIPGHFLMGNLLFAIKEPKAGRKHLQTALQLLATRPAEDILLPYESVTAEKMSRIIAFLLHEGAPA